VKRWATWLVIGLALAVGAAGVAVYVGAKLEALDRRFDQLSARLDRWRPRVARRWARPVLRGEPLPGNSMRAMEASIAALGRSGWRRELEDLRLHDDEVDRQLLTGALDERLVTLNRLHRAELDGVRASTQHEWAWAADTASGLGAGTSTNDVIRGLLVTAASAARPGECLEIAADSIRVVQDASSSELPSSEERDLASVAAHVALRCAVRASPGELAGAEREFRQLGRDAPPVGPRIELFLYQNASMIREGLRSIRRFPHNSSDLELLRRRAEFLAEMEVSIDHGLRWGAAAGASYAELVALATELEAQAHDRLADPWPFSEYTRWVTMATSATAVVRALALALVALRDGDAGLAAALADPELRDPFTGQPLRSRHDPAAIYSVGPNLRDDGGRRDDLSLELPPRQVSSGGV
jgi:hypothetical protein